MRIKNRQTKAKYYLNKQGEFVIENYNYAKPFANFFPGIAGKYGIPMWVFYVNRGQCIASFGTKDKDHAILEFFPANKSWQLVSSYGFRTFIKVKSAKENVFYEPFHNGYANQKYRINNSMRINSSQLKLEEENLTLGIKTRVEYFNIPNDSFAGLSRTVTVENTGRKPLNLQVIDGLSQIVPYGTNNFFLKKLGRTIEAWMGIDNLDKDIPFYKLQVDPADRPEVVHINGGNFYLGFHFKGAKPELIRPIVDPEAVFGAVTDFSYPAEFLKNSDFACPRIQSTCNKTPSAFLLLNLKLRPQEKKAFYALTGQARDTKTLNNSVKKITRSGYIEEKLDENNALIQKLKEEILTKSSSNSFDLYAGQTYLDNIMRGGYPQVFKSGVVFYLYSRKHGDLERDYNKFHLQPTYYSQGNGNYRDMNQNRRNDPWFNPAIKDENIIFFMNLIQTDGFNPLVIKGESFRIEKNANLEKILNPLFKSGEIKKLKNFFKSPFSPGELIFFLEENRIQPKTSYENLLEAILSLASKIQEAEHGEGFWTDHWAYNLDLIESYLGLYPEKINELFFNKKVFTFFDNIEVVRPRSERYVLYHGSPRQLRALAADPAKKELQRKRADHPHILRINYGNGKIYYTTLIAKLLCLAANKLSSLDPFGTGIEMEANKPNWFDSLNGLPALFGSSSCETFELKRLLKIIIKVLEGFDVRRIELAKEVAFLMDRLYELFPEDEFTYWDKSNSAKEDYRQNTRLGLSGIEIKLPKDKLIKFLNAALKKIECGLNKSFDKKSGVFNSYFINEVKEYELIKEHCVRPKKFVQKPAPLFLEGQMHALRVSGSANRALTLHQATKRSKLFDQELKMYKVCASLESMPEEIGRCRVFTPGWLENESIWLHMEYKYLLELLKNGLVGEFYAEFKNVLIPFQDPQRYGRSILENSSFLVSSVFTCKNLRGNGFVARLSGSTAEFIHIWLVMNIGLKPFTLDKNGALNLSFKPCLPGWLFDHQGQYSFNFLGKIPVTYHNLKKKNTFGKNAAKITKIILQEENQNKEINSPLIPSPWAEKIRAGRINKIDIYLG